MMTKKKLLDVKNLSVDFANGKSAKRILNNLDLSLDRGETLALVGSSGSGKTVAALSILQLLPHTARISKQSQVFFQGTDLLSQTQLQMRQVRGKRIGMIFQEASSAFNPVMTIGEQIDSSLKRHTRLNKNSRRLRILELLDKVGINDPARSAAAYPHMLSGGMRQRAMIAMALAPEPELLIADEPTTALDVTLQAQVLELLLEIQKQQNIGLLFVTHDLAIAKQIADHVAIMAAGEVLECEAAKTFFENPDHEYSQKLFNALPSWEKRQKEPQAHPVDARELLSVKDLNIIFTIKKSIFKKRRKILHAVNNANISINTGQTFALVGESGSGKTTLAKGILNLVHLHSGKVMLGHGLASKKKIQVIFQDPAMSMNPRMRVGQILAEGAKAQKTYESSSERQSKMSEMLGYVGLPEDCVQRYPHEFSGGQRQRICIARALLMQPELLICDEPTSALDVVTQMEILNLLRSLQNKLGISYLLITHNMSVVSYLAHKVAVMHRGEIVEQGDVEQVMFRPQHDYTKKLLAAVPVL
jgi:peptide/nickel transport system ATP-binding protein